MDDISAFVLAGGKSVRFGSDKMLYPYRGRPLISHVTGILTEQFAFVGLLADDGEKFSFLNLPVYPDIVKDAGPAGGLFTALSRAETEYVFLVSGDMPELCPGIISYMASLAGEHDVIIPFLYGEYEATHALYRRTLRAPLENLLSTGRKRIVHLFDSLSVRKVLMHEMEHLGNLHRAFRNINTPGDLD